MFLPRFTKAQNFTTLEGFNIQDKSQSILEVVHYHVDALSFSFNGDMELEQTA